MREENVKMKNEKNEKTDNEGRKIREKHIVYVYLKKVVRSREQIKSL